MCFEISLMELLSDKILLRYLPLLQEELSRETYLWGHAQKRAGTCYTPFSHHAIQHRPKYISCSILGEHFQLVLLSKLKS